MAFVSTYMNQQLQARMTDIVVDETFVELRKRSSVLEEYVPLRQYNSRDFMGLLVNAVAPIASVVAYGGEIPVTRFGELKKIDAQMVKLAIKHFWDEETQWKLFETMRNAQAKGVEIQDRVMPDGTLLPGENQQLVNLLFGSIKQIVTSINDAITRMTWMMLYTGALDFVDSRTNMPTKIDYKDPNATYNHFPDPLIQTGNLLDPSLNKWSDAENANGFQTISNIVEAFIATNGFAPEKLVMSRKLRKLFLEQKSTKDAARSSIASPYVGTVSLDMLSKLLEDRDLPPVVIYDEMYNLETESKDIAKVRFLPDDRICFLTKDKGLQRAMGITMESNPNVMADGGSQIEAKPGIHVQTYQLSPDSEIDVTRGVCTALPICLNPKILAAQKVN